MTIYKDNAPTAREIWLETDGTKVTMTQQDLGPACEMMSGSDEYEREVSCMLSDLKEKMGVEDTEELLGQLAERFNTADSIDRFDMFLTELHIDSKYFCC